jgi:hypothetical protein
MKKLGVIICGQPRFIKYTWKFIKEHYTIPGYETKFFGYLWSSVGYSKKNDVLDTYEPHEISEIISNDFEDIKIDDYTELDKSIIDFYEKTKQRTPKNISILKERYHFGQVYSKQEGYKLLQKYENKNNYMFDMIAVAKTDFIYRNQHCYRDKQTYVTRKQLVYDVDNDPNIIKTISANMLEYKEDLNRQINPKNWNEFAERKRAINYIKNYDEARQVLEKDGLFYRLRLNFHWLLLGRRAADFMLGKWYDTAIEIGKESIKVPILWKRIKSMGSMYGEIAIRNKLTVKNGNPRCFRVVNHNPNERPQCLDKIIYKKGKRIIICNFQDIKTEQTHLQRQL